VTRRKKLGIALLIVLLMAAGSCLILLSDGQPAKNPPAVSFEEAPGVSPDMICQTLVQRWLEGFRSTLRLRDRLVAYEIERMGMVESDDGGYRFSATFSVKPMSLLFSDWIAGNGVAGEDGWIRHKFLFFKVEKGSGQYTLQVLGTGP
jgi:hypothetical protein